MGRLTRVRVAIVLSALFLVAQPLTAATGAPESDAAASGASAREQSAAARLSQRTVRELRQNADGRVFVSMRESTDVAGFIRVARGGDLLPSNDAGAPASKAGSFLARFGEAFGVRDVSQLRLTSRSTDRYGATHLTYEQVYRGVPVFAAQLRVHLDAENRLTGVNGVFVPNLDLSTSPTLRARAAARLAIREVAADPPVDANGDSTRASVGDLRAESTTLVVYRIGLIRDVAGSNQLAYEVVVTNGANVREFVFVHAHGGKILNRYSAVHDDLHRVLYEISAATPPIWEEGDPFPGALNLDQQNILIASEDAYYHFFNAFGRDSYDGAGAFMRSVNNDPTIACPNANWNGATTNYCNGVTADDVVAHEWGHAYTQFTHDLIYQWQSGALNESYSDIWGETVDMLNGYGTDAPGGTVLDGPRDEGGCTNHSLQRNFVVINSPGSLAGFCNAGPAQFGPALTESGVTGNVVLADDGIAPTSNGCEPFVNAGAVSGNIALVDRGACSFDVKVENAQVAGATAVLVADNVWGPPDPMADGPDPTPITIPSVRITLQNGDQIKAALATSTVNVTMRLGLPDSFLEDNVRWLMGEDATAFGTPGPPARHAIRDMWNPRCVNDPGRVTDGEYFCSTLDGGGVHTNSGVPNHGYALLVDGGIYNGHAVSAIGLVKAAHLYFRAQSVYQTPSTNFNDHADSLQASCTDLIGIPLEGLSTTDVPAGPSGESISAADCAQVDEMIAAVELRTDPSEQCNFQPILQPGAPARCSDTPNEPIDVYTEDFEDGLGGWTLANEGVFSGWPGVDWVQATTLPGGREGAAAFGEDLQEGNCDLGAGDVSGHMTMTSGLIEIPDIAETTPRLTFDHYVATEAGWDGGNLKISINGGPFTVPVDAAYTFNSYNVPNLNTAAQGNTNPLAGQDGWTGTDGGSLGGSWGQSQLDLTALGVNGGDTIVLRFDFGMDGCTGIDGWYVDDVVVYLCDTAESAPTIRVVPGGTCNSNTSATLNLEVDDPDPDPDSVTLTGSSSNTGVVPNGGITFGGSGADRTVRIAASGDGTAVVTVTATDDTGLLATVDITVFVGGNGDDSWTGTAGSDLFLGGNGNDSVEGLGGNDLVCGGRGNDTIVGGEGDDTMLAGQGNDTLTGGTGADGFHGGPGTDTATDFNAGEGDTSTGIP